MITKEHLENYLNVIKADYASFRQRMQFSADANSIENFNNKLRLDEGKSYIKVVKDGSVHSFIVKQDTGKFKAGDVLKAASWKAPAKNFPRGNIITGDLSNISWSM